MKTRSLILFFLFFACLIQAQENYMALSFGAGVPLSEFANSTEIQNHGYANTGFVAEYSGAYYLHNKIGITGSARFTSNLIQKDEAEQGLIGLFPNEAEVIANQNIELGKWDIVSLSVGPQLTYPAGIINIDAYFLVGLNVVSSPQMRIDATLNQDVISTRLKTSSARFGWDAGFNLRVNLSEKSGVRFFVNYQQTSAKGDLEITGGQETRYEYKTKINLINSGIGLIYRL